MNQQKQRHTPCLQPRFGAHTASVIDVAHQDAARKRAGGHEVARFSTITYDGSLANTMAASPRMLNALRAAEAALVGKEPWRIELALTEVRAAIAVATGAA